jgi:hypothetical protein
MAKTISALGNVCLFLAGMAAGIIFSIYGFSRHFAENSPMEELNPIFRFPDIYYVVGALVMVALSVLLRRAARRIV